MSRISKKSVVENPTTAPYTYVTNNRKNMNKKKYTVKLPEEMEGGVYSNAISVHINNGECVLDFAYSLPNSPEATLKVVSRINMSHRTAESLMTLLSNAMLDYKNKNKNS